MVLNGIDTKGMGKLFNQKVTQETALWFEKTLKTKARTASRRTAFVRGANGKKYSYSKWQNTGQLAMNIRITKDGDKRIVHDGTRSNYSDGSYHGMYFLVEKAGERDVKNTLRQGSKFVEGLKLNI